jgi:ABC-type bacteriocin/lantibiotic exporter with double-glycine peptidase domain
MLAKLKYRFTALKALAPYAKGAARYFFLSAILATLVMLLSFVLPVFYRIFIDEVIIGRNTSRFVIVMAGYMACFFIAVALKYLRKYSDNKFQNRAIHAIRRALLRAYLCMPFPIFEKRETGDLKMRFDDDAGKLAQFGGEQTIEYALNLLTGMVASALILAIEWRLALFTMTVIPITFYINHRIGQKEKALQDENRVNTQKWNSWLQTSIQGWKEVKALNLQKREKRTYIEYAHRNAIFNGIWIYYWVLRVLIIPKIKDDFLMKFALYFVGGILILKNYMSIGSLLVFAMYYDILSEAVRKLTETDAALQGNTPFYQRAFEELTAGKNREQATLEPPNFTYDLEIKDISFSYPGAKPTIRGLSARINQGDRIAVIGPSGAGKTTLMKLITGMLVPDSGVVSIGGIPINEIDKGQLYQRIGFVMQENILFNLSIQENLLIANPRAKKEDLDKACAKACILDFIRSLPEGYGTIIGEKGIKLSGGQRQRIVLARIFMRKVNIIIFDEATSSIDQYSEGIIHDAIRAIDRSTTIIIVAHRESSIRLCDKKIVIGESMSPTAHTMILK